ncbi:hypothetical protein PhCBS80983_g01504 [Powellomyces hirtus]|uniref:P-loop containing nucleoside triphosphate hydrolase protein n=1 Tax=Powellomyces hirtus TaxID=109895 RepID=A0A507ECL4_9FUNG|nr:hypothetical protein PhCBS80983_g01504 [Powellomyces hirtus]
MAGGAAARSNRQKKGGGKGRSNGKGKDKGGGSNKSAGSRGGKKDSSDTTGRRGGGFRGLDILFDRDTEEVSFVQKTATARKEILRETMLLKKDKKWKEPGGKKKGDFVPELKIDPQQYKRLHHVLSQYQQAQKIMRQEIAARQRRDRGVAVSDSSELSEESEDEDSDEDEYEEESGLRKGERGQTPRDLMREMNGPAFYGHRDDFWSDEHEGSDNDDDDDDDDDGNEDDENEDSEADPYPAKDAWAANSTPRPIAKLASKYTRLDASDGDDDENDDGDGFGMWDQPPVTPTGAAAAPLPRQLVFIPAPDPRIPVDSVSRAWLESFSFSRNHATTALQRYRNDQLDALAYLYSHSADTTFSISTSSDVDTFIREEARTQRELERGVLELMYMRDFSSYARRDGTEVWQIQNLTVNLPPRFHDTTNTSPADIIDSLDITLQLHHPANTIYPFQYPLVTLELRNRPPGCTTYDPALLSLAIMLQTIAKDRIGETIVDLLTLSLQTAEAEIAVMCPSKKIKEIVCSPSAPAIPTPAANADPSRVLVVKGTSAKPTPPKPATPTIKLVKGLRGGVPTMAMLQLKMQVAITLKQDQGTDRLVRGKIDEFLTKGNHPRGIKVRLTDGRVGRVQAAVETTGPVTGPLASGSKPPITNKNLKFSAASSPSSSTPATPPRILPPTTPRTPASLDSTTATRHLTQQFDNMRINAAIPASPKPALVVVPTTPKPPRYRKPQPTAAQIATLNETLYTQYMQQQQQPAYVKMRMQRESLPAWKYQSQILEAVDRNRVVVVEGETGCGKTTQVPQFILDHFLSTRHGAECKILVTQPRRISAIGVAERVAAERAEPLGRTVGYQIRLESRMSEETRILFATTGILLRRLEGAGAKALVGNEPAAAVADEYEGGIDDLTHIIVDEVHERSVDSDFLLMVLRDLLATNPTLKLILMSATLNAGLFQDYFADHHTPRIHVPGRTFPVQVMFLEHALAKTRYVPQGKDFTKSTFSRQHRNPRDMDPDSESMDEEELPDDKLTEEQMKKRYPKLSDKAIGALRQMDVDKIQYPLIEMLVEWMCDALLPGAAKKLPPGASAHATTPSSPRSARLKPPPKTPKKDKAKNRTKDTPDDSDFLPFDTTTTSEPPPDRGILIFLPGFLEISTLHDALTRNPRIRAATQNGKWCIPLHGNLSSADQLRVFKRPDPGAVKIVVATNVAETSITVDDVVFVIDSGKMKETRYDPQKGMASLEECWVSRANAMQRRGRAGRVTKGVCVHLFTSHHFENVLAPQQVPEMRRTPLEQLCLRIKVLPFLNGRIAQILDKVIEPPSPEAVRQAVLTLRTLQALTKEEDLTPLGFHLGRLPLDVRIGKLLVFGSIFQCLDPVLTIAAAMSHKSPFVAPFEIRDQADRKKREFAIENSDQLTILNAYNAWQHTRTHNPASVEKKFLFDNFLSGKSLAMIANVKRQLAELISDIGFLETPVTARAIERVGRATGSDGVKESIGERANHRGDDLRLVKALLLAALYPNVIKVTQGVKPDGGDTQLLVRGNEEVFIHPTSINFRKPHPPGTFLAYHEKVKTSKVYIRDASAVPAAAVAFFGGSLGPYEPRGGGLLPMDDGWLRFRAHNPKIAAVVRAARVALDELLQEKIRDPSAMFEGELVTCIVDVVTRHAA